jgi:hypothetical protein
MPLVGAQNEKGPRALQSLLTAAEVGAGPALLRDFKGKQRPLPCGDRIKGYTAAMALRRSLCFDDQSTRLARS